ncbi:hypothetical protein [Xenorhabdus bovienii]|uniref:hypothetical protein n=1 Tax=Xenorhabdus bovienii TaxID=40576 RepID=UPI0023B33FC3|nr:hypothetical protein [Xenorhabdus bovienii]MDE9487235.1 hypothetical protein [Xenorhabdus bovienii]MDE9590346.1 hypothetical protein [Xenorhabdus bovienii]
MAKLHLVVVDEKEFNVIKNNKNKCIGVAATGEEGFSKGDLERIQDFFIIKCVGIENIFCDQNLPTSACKGSFILLCLAGENGGYDVTSQRVTIRINEVHHFQNDLNLYNEINISFYEYSLLTPAYFFNEGAGNGQ